jgi:hypothetical protein
MDATDEPKLLNLIEIETRWGYRAFELYQGDLLAFRHPVDLLAISGLARDLRLLLADPSKYATIEYTLIGALYCRAGIDVARLGADCEFDLRGALGCWVSRPTNSASFKRVVCVEDIGLARTVEEAVDNLFVAAAVLEAKSVEVRTLLLPLLGAGGMRLDPEAVMQALLASSQRHLSRLNNLERVYFIERDPDKATSLSQAMNTVLQRVKVALPKGELIEGVRRDILERVKTALVLAPEAATRLLADLRRIVSSEESRSFEIGIVGRRLVEFVVQDFPGAKPGRPLANGIDGLAAHGVADWVRSYMHTVRVFGNESAHEKGVGHRIPPVIGEADIALCLFCVLRVLEFWIEARRKPG